MENFFSIIKISQSIAVQPVKYICYWFLVAKTACSMQGRAGRSELTLRTFSTTFSKVSLTGSIGGMQCVPVGWKILSNSFQWCRLLCCTSSISTRWSANLWVLKCDIQTKANEQYFPVVLLFVVHNCKTVPTFDFVNLTPAVHQRSNES